MTYAVSEWEGATGSPAHYSSPHGCTRTLTPSRSWYSFYRPRKDGSLSQAICPGVELNRYRHDWTCTWVGALTKWASQAERMIACVKLESHRELNPGHWRQRRVCTKYKDCCGSSSLAVSLWIRSMPIYTWLAYVQRCKQLLDSGQKSEHRLVCK